MADFDSTAGSRSADASDTVAPQFARRRFLQIISGIGAGISAVLIGVPVVRAFITPALTAPPKDDWLKVTDDIALLDVGTPIRLNVVVTEQDAWIESRAVKTVWLFTEDGEKFKAYSGRCTHLGCGFVYDKDANDFTCPCHKGHFDIKTGKVLAGPPPRPLDELEVDIRDSAVFVKYKEYRLGVPEQIEV